MDAPRQIELSRSVAVRTETAEIFAARAVALDAVVPRVHDDHVAVRVERDSGGAVELAVTIALNAELGYELAFLVELGDPVSRLVADVEVARGRPLSSGRATLAARRPIRRRRSP